MEETKKEAAELWAYSEKDRKLDEQPGPEASGQAHAQSVVGGQ